MLKYITLFIVFLPLLNCISIFINNKKAKDYTIWIFSFALFLVFILLFYYIYLNNNIFLYDFTLSTWFSSATYVIYWNFRLDHYSLWMFFIVISISFSVHIYSFYYMSSDPNFEKFLIYLSLFTFFMLFLVSSGNLIQLFIGWEGVGLCSFLLISFWSERFAAVKAAVKAMVVNKIGDCFIMIAIAFLLQVLGTVDFSVLFSKLALNSLYGSSLEEVSSVFFIYDLVFLSVPFFGYTFSLISVICFFLFLGIMAKSAQFGFHTWLPDAMEGPTPVSALIHAATMVTAGVFLLLRFSTFFELSSSIQKMVVFFGVLTAIFAATTALVQNDIKKVIAYSTCSQLGYMITACGFSFYGAAFFHLLSHAFFKALLFLSAGVLIHFSLDNQDVRKMGAIVLRNPISMFSMFIANLALVGFPFTSGYYSKDLILESIYSLQTSFSTVAYFFLLFTAFLTSFYSFRIFYLSLFKNVGDTKGWLPFTVENYYVKIVFVFLSFFSTVFGYLFSNHFLIQNYDPSTNFLFFSFTPLLLLAPFLVMLFGILLVFVLYVFNFSILSYFSLLFRNFIYSVKYFFSRKWHVDSIYNYFFVKPFFEASTFSFFFVEKGWLEYFGPTQISQLCSFFSVKINNLQNNDFFNYIFYLFAIIWLYFFFSI